MAFWDLQLKNLPLLTQLLIHAIRPNPIETEEPSSSLIQFEPQDFNEMNVEQPEFVSQSYYQKTDDERDDLKMHVEQKGEISWPLACWLAC